MDTGTKEEIYLWEERRMNRVWKGTWNSDGSGGWHTKTGYDIVEEYRSARRTADTEKLLARAIDEIVLLRSHLQAAYKVLEESGLNKIDD